jgi:cell division transport system ATP-binding protein
VINLSHVYKTYTGPVHALRDVNFEIGKGEFVFLTGPSGAGKTTLFRMISAFDKPTSGHVSVGEFSIGNLTSSEIPYYRRRIGVVFQDFRLLKHKTIFENVALPLVIRGEPHSIIRHKVMETLDLLGIAQKADQYPDFISGGEQQRTAIARAIVHQPFVLIADEPTGNLDHHLAQEIMCVLEQICAQGTTVFVATHDTFLIEKYKKRRIEIKDGSIHGVTHEA